MVEQARDGFRRLDGGTLDRVNESVATLRASAQSLTSGILSELGNRPGFEKQARLYLALPMHLERIADRGESLAAAIRKVKIAGLPFTEKARREVDSLMEATLEVLAALKDLVRTWSPVLATHVVEAGDRAETLTDEYAQSHRDRMIGGECVPMSSPVYLSILDHLSSIRRHAREMAMDLAPVTRPRE